MEYECSCGNLSKISWANFNCGKRCKNCRNINNRKRFSFSQEYVEEYFKNQQCKLLDKYTNNRTKMNYICHCGNKSKISFSNFRKGKRCQECKRQAQLGKSKYTHKEVEDFFKKENCILLEVYVNATSPIQYICSCGNQSKTSYTKFRQGRRCKFCRQSHGERAIEIYLKSKKIKFKKQCKFSGCRNKKPLSFDFAITIKGQLKLIEYQGRQHYEPVNFGSKKVNYQEEFKNTLIRDNAKRKWCNENKIPLLEISYKKFKSIEKIIDNFI